MVQEFCRERRRRVAMVVMVVVTGLQEKGSVRRAQWVQSGTLLSLMLL
jgi:hypothetical protein